MKKYRLTLLMGGVFSLVASACTNEAASAKTNTKTSEPTQDITKVGVTMKPKIDVTGPFAPKATELTPDQVVASFTNPADASKYTLKVENSIPVVDGDSKGEIKFNVLITNKSNSAIQYHKQVLVTGLRKSFGGYIDVDTLGRFGPNDLHTYNLMSRYQQFQSDNAKYMTQLKLAIAHNIQHHFDGKFELSEFRTDVQTSQKDRDYFNKKANELKLNTYDDSLIKGFGVPVYKDNPGKDPTVEGINLYDGEMNKFKSWRDVYGRDEYKANGLPRILPNQKYKDIALQTYAFSVDNKATDPKDIAKLGPDSLRTTRGTMWILDYVPTTDKSYPTTWYFGTNLHVADALTNDTKDVSFSILKDSVATKTRIDPANGVDEKYFDNYHFPNLTVVNQGVAEPDNAKDSSGQKIVGQPAGIRTVFTADDYLNTDPKDYLVMPAHEDDAKNTAYSKYHEFLDFAVIEIDFKALWNTSIASHKDGYDNSRGFTKPEDYARQFTRDYADHPNKQISFLTQSYLSDYKRVDYPFANKQDSQKAVDLKGYDTFYLLGYPLSKGDWGIEQYEDGKQLQNNGHTVSLWVNGESGWFNNPLSIPEDKATTVGDQLSTNVGYQTFPEKPGIVDSFISASRAGANFYSSPHHRGGAKLIDFGLEYVPRHYAPYGGSSGSSMRNQNNQLVAVFHVGNINAMAGLAAAFRSEGFDYHGLYGNYNLPQYDLIYGGGRHQQKSFRQSLQLLYGDTYHTNLFKNITEIPKEFQFHNNTSIYPPVSAKY